MLQRANTSSPKKADNQHGSSAFIASLLVQQLQDMITNTIRAQYGDAPHVKTCNNAGTGDLLVKQFVRSLQGNAFDWYTDIEPEFIDIWE